MLQSDIDTVLPRAIRLDALDHLPRETIRKAIESVIAHWAAQSKSLEEYWNNLDAPSWEGHLRPAWATARNLHHDTFRLLGNSGRALWELLPDDEPAAQSEQAGALWIDAFDDAEFWGWEPPLKIAFVIERLRDKAIEMRHSYECGV
jgi:hypothetical protein